MSKQCNRHNGEAGFSLLELMVVLIIMLVMMALAIPLLLQAIEGYQMEGAARSVAALVGRARYDAMRRNTRTCVAFIPSPFTPGEIDYLMNTTGAGADPCAAAPAYDVGEVYYALPRPLVLGGAQASATCPITGMPAPWAFSAAAKTGAGVVPPAFQVSFSSRGYMELPGVAPGTWTVAREVEYFCLLNPPAAASADAARFAFLVYLEPTGKVRLFRRQGRNWFTMQ